MYALSGVSFVALETYNVVSSAASYLSTPPHVNHFSTNQALSNRYFHGYLSADVSAQRLALCPCGVLVDGTRQRRFAGTNPKPHKLPENAATPTTPALAC